MDKNICPTETALDVIGGKWKGMILFYLSDGKKRFNELRRLVPGITQRMLTKQLRELEENNLVHREVYPVVPPKVEYSLTTLGQELSPVLGSLKAWGQNYLKSQKA